MSALDCPRTEELLSDWIEGGLDAVMRHDVDTHLKGCPACRELVAVMQDVLGTLRPQAIEPPRDLAARAAQAALIAGRRRQPIAPLQFPAWVPALAASLALTTTLAVVGITSGGVGRAHRIGERAATASVYLTERKDRLVEDLHLLRVVLATMVEGRIERVNDLVDDYRRRQQKRPAGMPSAPQKTQNIRASGLVRTCELPVAHASAPHAAHPTQGART